MGIAETILNTVGEIFDKVIPDKNKRAEAKESLELALQSNDFQLALSQIKVNEVEAGSGDNFTRRWRPFIGWVCGLAFALHYLIFPIIDKITVIFGGHPQSIQFDMQTLMWALGGLLGIGGYRTIEKIRGVA